MRRAALLLALALIAGCRDKSPPKSMPPIPDAGSPVPTPIAAHSGPVALSADGATLFVANPDLDSISIVDLATRQLTHEVLLSGAHPIASTDGGEFTPSVMPRALALTPDGKTVLVTGERSGKLYRVDVATGNITDSLTTCSEPAGVLASSDGRDAYVACSNDDRVVRIDLGSLTLDATATVPRKPWALAASTDGELRVTHLLGPGVSLIDPSSFSLVTTWPVPDVPPRGDKRLAHGQVRGIYDAAEQPGTGDLWTVHMMLGTDTAQPELDFESTAFPTLSVLHQDGTLVEQLSTDAQDVPGIDGALADIVSGPRALAFTHDGDFALMVDADSEDVLAVDTHRNTEAALLRPLPGHLPEGIAIAPDDTRAYVVERNTLDVAVIQLTREGDDLALAVDGDPISLTTNDPMPAQLRLGQHLFYSANSDEAPITTNHWVACATCHIEGRSDAVTWLFEQGPRDTPTNAGGMIGTGFLFRTADRNKVQDYWHTINVEQGGHFDPNDPLLAPMLDAIAAYVNGGIPAPIPPTTDPAKVAAGDAIFHSQDVGCIGCHSGARHTDSGSGNPTLDLAGNVVLHDVGTCVTTGLFPDVAHEDVNGDPRAACMFDTPSLTGVYDSAPYLHDGSAATLHDVLIQTRGHMGNTASLSDDDLDNLVEYLKSL
ncbi:MAG: hypothetical protein JST54_24945 [Deltaproteobacteria bacterium]|nr:hypothetical protein [Deltaproteobacteria bacterium]